MQTQTSNALHNVIMEAGSKDRPPILAPDREVQATEGGSVTTESYMENYKNVLQDIHDQLNDEAEAIQIILIRIDNDIYSTVDACPNACEMWKAIARFYKMMNELVRNQCDVTNHQVNVQFLLQLQLEWQRANQDNSLRFSKGTRYDNQRIGNVVGARENVEQADWKDDTDDKSEDQELEAHYIYMAKLQEVTPIRMIKEGASNEEAMRLNLDLLQERIEASAIREVMYKMKLKHYYDKRLRPTSFMVGEYVYQKNEASRMKNLGKLGPKWEGPYLVTKAHQNGSYKL
nr:reverse transcriptase domain-containing protein [Tanacetum cinerariifolium]